MELYGGSYVPVSLFNTCIDHSHYNLIHSHTHKVCG
jgi:hypothetical protein